MEDAEVKAIEAQFVLGKHKEMRCEGHHLIQKMCINPKCTKKALLCKEEDCKYCNDDAHECARKPLRGLRGVTELLEAQAMKLKDFMVGMFRIELDFIHELRRVREEFIRQYRFSSILEERDLRIIDDIFEKGNPNDLRGK